MITAPNQGVVQPEPTGNDWAFYILYHRQNSCKLISRRLLLDVRDDTVKEHHKQYASSVPRKLWFKPSEIIPHLKLKQGTRRRHFPPVGSARLEQGVCGNDLLVNWGSSRDRC